MKFMNPSDPLPGPPMIFVLGGPNGAGKTTCALRLLPEELKLAQFVNADLIAQGLSPLSPDSAAMEAGRLMLERVHKLAQQGTTFAFETTLASRSFAPFLGAQKKRGYRVHVAYVWIDSADLSVERVRQRKLRGGHFVDEETVRRRYARGLRNFVDLHAPLADTWILCDNSSVPLRIVATGGGGAAARVSEPEIYAHIQRACCRMIAVGPRVRRELASDEHALWRRSRQSGRGTEDEAVFGAYDEFERCRTRRSQRPDSIAAVQPAEARKSFCNRLQGLVLHGRSRNDDSRHER